MMIRILFLFLTLAFLVSCQQGLDDDEILPSEPALSFVDEAANIQYSLVEAPKDYVRYDEVTHGKRTRICPPYTEYFCPVQYSGLGCWTEEDCESPFEGCNYWSQLDNQLNHFVYGTRNCRERIVDRHGNTIAIPGNVTGISLSIDIALEEVNDPDCPEYTGYFVFTEEDCIPSTKAEKIVESIWVAAQAYRPWSATGQFLLYDVHVYYTQKIELCGGLGNDPCYCDNKRLVARLTYKEELVGLCGGSTSG